jgi:peroxiredoxin
MESLGKLMGSAEEASKKVLTIRHLTAPTAPDFMLRSMDGDSVRLSSLRGKVVVIDFWATWCGPCVAELPYLQKLHDRYRDDPDVRFLCISTDNDSGPVRPFIEKKKYTMKVLYSGRLQPGARGSVETAYGIKSIPQTFLLDREGKIELKHSGFGGDGEAWLRKMERDIGELLQFHPERE